MRVELYIWIKMFLRVHFFNCEQIRECNYDLLTISMGVLFQVTFTVSDVKTYSFADKTYCSFTYLQIAQFFAF